MDQQTQRALAQSIDKNKKIIAGLAILLVIGLVGLWVNIYLSKNAEKKASDEFAALRTEVQEKAKNLSPSQPETKDTAPTPSKKTGDLAVDWGDTPTKLKDFALKNKNRTAAVEATVAYVSILSEYKKSSEASELISQVASEQGSRPKTQSFLLMILGNTQAEAQNCKDAATNWEKAAQVKGAEFVAAEAYLRSGICYHNLKEKPKAKEMFEKALAVSAKESAQHSQAQQYLRAVDVL